jgi:hypothetical protein
MKWRTVCLKIFLIGHELFLRGIRVKEKGEGEDTLGNKTPIYSPLEKELATQVKAADEV